MFSNSLNSQSLDSFNQNNISNSTNKISENKISDNEILDNEKLNNENPIIYEIKNIGSKISNFFLSRKEKEEKLKQEKIKIQNLKNEENERQNTELKKINYYSSLSKTQKLKIINGDDLIEKINLVSYGTGRKIEFESFQ